MKRYSNVTTPELIRHGTGQTPHPAYRRALIRALAERLEQEYQRAEQHKDKTIQLAKTMADMDLELTMACTAPPGPGYIKVAKPHIQQVFTRPGNKGMWRCTGSFGTVQYGDSPSKAYAAWRRVMERGHGIPR